VCVCVYIYWFPLDGIDLPVKVCNTIWKQPENDIHTQSIVKRLHLFIFLRVLCTGCIQWTHTVMSRLSVQKFRPWKYLTDGDKVWKNLERRLQMLYSVTRYSDVTKVSSAFKMSLRFYGTRVNDFIYAQKGRSTSTAPIFANSWTVYRLLWLSPVLNTIKTRWRRRK
jgi:hypothetical protein